MDALGRVTEGQSPRPDPNLAPAYLALMPLRASAVRVRRGAHHAHPQGMQGTPPERLHHRRSRRGRALSVNQPPRGIGSQSLSGTPTVGPRPGAGPGTGRCTWNARPLARLSESVPGRLSHKRRGEERSGANPRPHGWKEVGPVGRSGEVGQVHTSGLDQEHHPESLPHAVNGTRPWAGNCGSRWHDWSECLQPGRRQSCRMAVSVAGRAQRGVGRGARHSIDDSDHS